MKEIIVFGAPWCSGCKALKKALEDNNIPFEYVNVDDKPERASEEGVRSLPTTIIKAGKFGEVHRIVGNKYQEIKKAMFE